MTASRPLISEALYEVVWPLGKSAYDTRAPNERIADLSGKTIGELWDYLFRGEEIFPIVREKLTARFPGIKFVNYDVFGNVHGPQQRELVADVPKLLEQHGCDAVISAIGAWGACTPAVLRASAAVEHAGYPSVSIISSGFLKQAAVVAKGLGLPDMAIAEYPGVPMTDSKDELRRKVEEVLLPRIISGLSKPLGSKFAIAAAAEPAPSDIVLRGTLDEINEHFYRNFWSDGLPIIPPTPARVERFLRFTDRAPDEVIGLCPPANRLATVWNVAVNGVMAGCRPEYMPVLLAVVEAVTDPVYKVEDAGSTPGWESLIVVNGPIVKELGFNAGQGVMRPGIQANTSVGRFLRLFLRNLAGFYHAPEGADKGSIGQSFLVAAAENEDAVAEIGWQPYSVDRGFKAGDNIVTVQSVVAISAPTYTGSEKAIEHAELIADVIGSRACGYWTAIGMVYSNWHPLLMLGPGIAKVFAQEGWSKDDIRRYLYENVKIKASQAERYAYHCGQTGFRVNDYVKQGLLPPAYGESDDPDRLLPVFQRPEWIGIIIAGDWGRNQSKGYVSNHIQGPPVSKPVRLPGRWQQLLANKQP